MIRLSQPHQTPRSRIASRLHASTPAVRIAVVGVMALLGLLALSLAVGPFAWAQSAGQSSAGSQASAPAKFAGTYRIEGWKALEERGLYHFFYLHPDGHFLLAGEWPDNERSRFVGTWSVVGNRMYLNGKGAVDTNQGAWRTEYTRTFRIQVTGEGFLLSPEPAKNRFGLMGWPNAFRYYRGRPVPNLPGEALPEDADEMDRYIAQALQRMR